MKVPRVELHSLGYINPKPLKWDNEPARHKLMDLIGDLALIGRPLKGRGLWQYVPGIQSTINSHALSARDVKHTEIQAPVYNPNLAPLIDVNGIRHLLPTGIRSCLSTKSLRMDQKHIVCVKNVTVNEPFFQGHFPRSRSCRVCFRWRRWPRLRECSCSTISREPEKYSTYFLKIDNVKVPSEGCSRRNTLLLNVSLMTEIRRGCAIVKGYAFVGEKIVCEAEFMAQIIKTNKRWQICITYILGS